MLSVVQTWISIVSSMMTFTQSRAHPQRAWKMALGSCLHPSSRPWLSLSSIARSKPDTVFLLGDLVYADYDPVSLQWERPGSAYSLDEGDLAERFNKAWHVTMSEPNFVTLLNSSANIYAIWDDHEFVNNYDRGVDTVLYQAGRAAFDRHLLPSLANPVRHSGGYFTVSFPFAELFALDTRSYREQVTLGTERTATVLGQSQKHAFREWLQAVPKGKWTLVASSGMLNTYPGDEEIDTSGDCAHVDCRSDPWYRFPGEREEIIDMVVNATENALFLTGDSHYAGIFRLGKNILEISASPLGAFGFPPPGTAFDAVGNDVVWIGGGEQSTNVFGEIQISDDLSLTLSLNNVDLDGRISTMHSHNVGFQHDDSTKSRGGISVC